MGSEMIVVTLLAWIAFLFSRTLQKRRIPELVAFLAVGAAFGPSGADLLTSANLRALSPITQIALAFLMFIVGERVSVRALRGAKWIVLSGAFGYVLAGSLVWTGATLLGADTVTALFLAVLAGAGAPMTVSSVIVSVKAKSRFSAGLVGSHAVADALAAVGFAIALPIALSFQPEVSLGEALRTFVRFGLGGAVLGILLGLVVGRLSQQSESTGELLLLVMVHVLVASTIADLTEVSLPLAALVMGSVAASAAPADSSQRLFVAARGIEQPLYLIFFALAGASIHLEDLPKLGGIGIAYIALRSIGKVGGGAAGGLAGGLQGRRAVWLGVDMLPQAGVAVGLAVVAAELLGSASDAATIVLGSVVIFELVGPLLVARDLRKEKSEAGTRGAMSGNGEEHHVDEKLPDVVLLATTGSLLVPSWLLDWCSRAGAELAVLAPGPELGGGDDPQVKALRHRAAQENVPVHWHELDVDQSFAVAVVSKARELHADLAAVVVPPTRRSTRGFRINAGERIASRLNCPVLLLPGPQADLTSLSPFAATGA